MVKTTDEDGNVLYEFSNIIGQLLLSRSINAGVSNDTYHVYDLKGNLTYVLSPMASSALSSDGTWSAENQTILDFCYRYEYDGRNRMIEKKLPGCDPVCYVYDKSDRVLFSQDGEQASKDTLLWSFFLYDRFDRPVITGECEVAGARALSDAEVYCLFDLVANNYNTGYRVVWPDGTPINNPTILSVNYYDNYQFKTSTLGFSGNLNYTGPQLAGSGYTDTRHNPGEDNIKSKGMLTGSVVSQLDNPSLRRYSVYHHDNKGRVVFSSSTNHLPGYDRTYTNYTHTGSAKLEILEQTTEGSINPVTEKYVYSYDHAGRLTGIDHSYNTNPAVRIAQNSYDNTGRLASVRRNSTNALLTQYSYNVRSWITGITSPGFNQEIVYNRATLSPTTTSPGSPRQCLPPAHRLRGGSTKAPRTTATGTSHP